MLTEHDLSLICSLLWFMWKARNEMNFDHRQLNPSIVIELARKSNFNFWANCAKGVRNLLCQGPVIVLALNGSP